MGILIFAAVIVGILIAVIVGAVLVIGGGKEKSVQEPIPGGGGQYTMVLDGVNCEHCKANAEAALNAFDGIRATVDLKTQTAVVRYTGYPDMELLDRLKAAIEQAGFVVKEIR